MRIITLLTDFGTSDAYPGVLHGVILSINPQAVVVDLSHSIAAQDVHAAAFALWTTHRFFPSDAIHVAVVDPGVGTGRRCIAVQASHGTFVAPDNGILTRVLQDNPVIQMVELTNPAYWLRPLSNTFHARDLFAPVAAHLSLGVALGAMGPALKEPVWLALPQAWRDETGLIHGEVQHVDRFGNLITNIPGAWASDSSQWVIMVAGHAVEGPVTAYAGAGEADLLALVGSCGYIEVGLRNGSASQKLEAVRGTQVCLSALR